MNLTLAMNFTGNIAVSELPAAGLSGADVALENGTIAGFAGLLSGLTAEAAVDAVAAPLSDPDFEEGDAVPTGLAVPQSPLPADGKILPPLTGNTLPDAAGKPVMSEPAEAAPLPLEEKNADPLTLAAKNSGDQTKTLPDQPASARPATSQSQVQPLQLQLTARTPMLPEHGPKIAAKPSAPTSEEIGEPAALSSSANLSMGDAAKAPAPLNVSSPAPNTSQSPAEQPVAQQAQPQQAQAQSSTMATPAQVTAMTPSLAPEPAMPAARVVAESQPQDFEAIVQRLSEARDSTRFADTGLRVLTREFGQVAMQFEIAGRALKVSLTSNDAGFAPAVQAAIAERGPLIISDVARLDPARTETTPGRGENSQQGQTGQHSSQAGQSNGGQGLGSGGRHNGGQSDTARSGQTNSPQPQTQGSAGNDARDHGLFA